MLKRIGYGLALCMMKEIIELIIKTTTSADYTAVYSDLDVHTELCDKSEQRLLHQA